MEVCVGIEWMRWQSYDSQDDFNDLRGNFDGTIISREILGTNYGLVYRGLEPWTIFQDLMKSMWKKKLDFSAPKNDIENFT